MISIILIEIVEFSPNTHSKSHFSPTRTRTRDDSVERLTTFDRHRVCLRSSRLTQGVIFFL